MFSRRTARATTRSLSFWFFFARCEVMSHQSQMLRPRCPCRPLICSSGRSARRNLSGNPPNQDLARSGCVIRHTTVPWRASLQHCDFHIMFDIVLPWENPRWIVAFVTIVVADAAIVFGVARLTQVKASTVFACVIILTDIGVLVWFRQSAFRNRKALRDLLMVYLGSGIVLAGSWILYDKSQTGIAVSLILIVLLLRTIWRRPLLKRLQAENEKERSVG